MKITKKKKDASLSEMHPAPVNSARYTITAAYYTLNLTMGNSLLLTSFAIPTCCRSRTSNIPRPLAQCFAGKWDSASFGHGQLT